MKIKQPNNEYLEDAIDIFRMTSWLALKCDHIPLSKKEGFVYIAFCETGHIKIGKSITPWKRIKHFQTIMPIDVVSLSWFYCDDMHQAEMKLHKYLDQYRYKGEWFILPPEKLMKLSGVFCYLDNVFHFLKDINVSIKRILKDIKPTQTYIPEDEITQLKIYLGGEGELVY